MLVGEELSGNDDFDCNGPVPLQDTVLVPPEDLWPDYNVDMVTGRAEAGQQTSHQHRHQQHEQKLHISLAIY